MRVFLSHINEEAPLAEVLKDNIERALDCEVFVAGDARDLHPGDDWFDQIRAALSEAKVLVVLCSPVSLTRPWVNFETGAAWALEKTIIPVCHRRQSKGDLPAPFNRRHAIELAGDRASIAEACRSLMNALAKVKERRKPLPDVFESMAEAVFNALEPTMFVVDSDATEEPPVRSLFSAAPEVPLTAEEHNILVAIENDDKLTADQLEVKTSLSPTRVVFYINKLVESKHLFPILGSIHRPGSPTLYTLGQRGREYIVKNDLDRTSGSLG